VDSVTPVMIVAALILLNGLFVAAEFSVVGVPRAAMERLALQGHRVAGAVARILREPQRQDRFFATAQIGITFASLGLGMYGEHRLATWLEGYLEGLGSGRFVAAHVVASVVAVGVLTYLHIVLGEMVPKSIALQRPERVALLTARPMLLIRLLLYPLVVTMNGIGNLILKAVGIDRQRVSPERYYTPEELQFVVRESEAGGVLRQESAHMLQELFEFGDRVAGEVMVPRVRVVGIPVGAGVVEIRQTLLDARHTRYPVYEENLDQVSGMVHTKDLLRLVMEGRPLIASDARRLPVVPVTAPLDSVLATMRAERTQMAVVIDEHGGTAGIVTLEDLVEEVIGEIEEADTKPKIYRDPDGRIHVPGTYRLDEVGEQLGLEIDHEEVDSVSGLVLMLLGRPAEPGDAVEYRGLRFEVTEVEGLGVRECAVASVERRGESDSDKGV
jgi:CBS domain containing-hemolysin-like protein